MDLQLRGKVALVVGSTGGIGAGVAEALAAEGCRLAITGRDQARLTQQAEGLAKHGVELTTIVCDLEDPTQAEAAARQAEAKFGQVDVVAFCAGNARLGGFEAVGDADIDSTTQVKLMGPVRLVRATVPGMRSRGYGRIVLIGGNNGRNPSGGAIVGGIVNAGMANFSRQVAKEVAGTGVTVNVIDPGSTRTARWERRLDQLQERQGLTRDEAEARASAVLPLKRPVEPSEIGDLVAFLASPRTAAVNGTIIPVDGGASEGLY
jgi:NAD(P)-dependent dehydrogenase (short-subunit alcohol dehydrogenase family)